MHGFVKNNEEMAKSNGELIETAVRQVRDIGRKVATVEEAKKILQLDEVRAAAKAPAPRPAVATA